MGTVCAVPGCPAIATAGGRCAAHQRPAYQRPRVDERPSSNERGYDYGYQQARAKLLRQCPDCVLCGERAVVAHHTVAGDDDSLLALCRDCHERLHGRKR